MIRRIILYIKARRGEKIAARALRSATVSLRDYAAGRKIYDINDDALKASAVE